MTEADASTATVPHRRRWPLFAIAAATVLAVAVAVTVALWPKSGLDKLAAHDKPGARACDMLATWLRGELHGTQSAQTDPKLSVSFAVSDFAADATTPAIRGAVDAPILDEKTLTWLHTGQYYGRNPRFTDLRKLHAGCTAAGVDMPPYTDSPKQG